MLEGERRRDVPGLRPILLARRLDVGGVGEGAGLLLGAPHAERGVLGAEVRHRGAVLLDRVADARREEPERRARAAPERGGERLRLHVGRDDERDRPVARRTMALPQMERKRTETADSPAPTAPPAGKGAAARAPSARCASDATERIRTA